MAERFTRGLAAISAAVLLGGWIGTAAAQPAPLPSMPMPPSASDPAPKATKGKARKPARKRAAESQGQGAVTNSSGSFDRPNRYVPEEFDRERGGSGAGGATPMMSPSGRPGMGMRF